MKSRLCYGIPAHSATDKQHDSHYLGQNLWEIKDEEDPKIWIECLIEADDSPGVKDRDIWDAFEATVPALKAHFLAEFPLDPIAFGYETREELWRALYGAAVNANEAKIRSIRPVELQKAQRR